MDKYKKLLQIKPPYLKTNYLTHIVNKSDIVFTHKTLKLEFDNEKKIMVKKTTPSKKRGGLTTLVF